MTDVRIRAIGRSNPEQRYTQRELYAHSPWSNNPLLDRLFLDSPIQTRALFVPPEWYRTPRDLTETNAAWKQGALALGGEALQRGLAASAVPATDVDLIAVTSVTGYCTPGLDLLLARAHGLRPDVARVHFNNIGCHAAVPLLRAAADHVRAKPASTAVALAVEVCSACFAEDDDPQNLVALSLFADGAAAAILGTSGSGPILVDFGSAYDFDHIDALGFDLTTRGFRIVLDPAIPDHIARGIHGAVGQLLDRHGLRVDDIHTWCLHPGGSRILDAVQASLRLSDEQLRASRRVLRGFGNMSSPSVLFVLAESLASRPPPTDSYGVIAAFGPGLGIEVALLRFDAPTRTA